MYNLTDLVIIMSWNIGNIEIKNRVVLAPMAGISNPAYMKICEDMGVGYAVTELISSEAIIRDNKKTFDMLNGINNLNIPFAIQLFGSNPSVMAEAAKIVVGIYPNCIIDINMGCPVPKVAIKSKAGSSLLKDPELVKEIVKSVVESVDVPVTVKIRSGWDEKNINAVEIARIVEEAGAKAIAIHARTRAQGYSGKANWDIIKDVKKAVKIPVIGNGDVIDCYSAKRMIDYTNCDAVMIGRALMGNPWLIKDINNYIDNGIEPCDISFDERIRIIKKHYELLISYKCEKVANLEMRSNIMWYLKGIPNSKLIKSRIMECNNKEEVYKVLDEIRN